MVSLIMEILFVLLSVWMALYGINLLYLTIRFWLMTRNRCNTVPPAPDRWPSVTLQFPVYNELHVVDRLLRSASLMDYPKDRLEIQILDDSTDGTREATP